MRSALFASVLLWSTVGAAQVFRGDDGLSIGLSHKRAVLDSDGDLHVGLRTIEAAHGIRCGGTDYQPRVATSFEARCEVRSASGQVHQLWVSLRSGSRLEVRLQPELALELPSLVGQYQPTATTIDGLAAEPAFGALKLMDDGHYRLGSGGGRWWKHGDELVFDGPLAAWGTPAATGEGLSFSFLRGPMLYEVHYTRLTGPSAPQAQRSAP